MSVKHYYFIYVGEINNVEMLFFTLFFSTWSGENSFFTLHTDYKNQTKKKTLENDMHDIYFHVSLYMLYFWFV